MNIIYFGSSGFSVPFLKHIDDSSHNVTGVFTYMDRIPEQYICLLGSLKLGCMIGPLFSAFGPDALKDRLGDCEAKVLITSPKLVKTAYEVIDDLSKRQDQRLRIRVRSCLQA